jgi:hypothetical protein
MINDVINRIRSEMLATFSEVLGWFDVKESLLSYEPPGGGWNSKKILEHLSLTNHYLLILIGKGVRKSVAEAGKGRTTADLEHYDLDWERMKMIGEHGSFKWDRPAHMEPKGALELSEVKAKLEMQLQQCLNYLDSIKNGEGVLYKTMMRVNNLEKIDVYHYIYFLIQHLKRHVTQMEKIKSAFDQQIW